jgi:hypothetical protein
MAEGSLEHVCAPMDDKFARASSLAPQQRKLGNKVKRNRRDVAQTPLLMWKQAQLRRLHRQGDTAAFNS